MKVEGGITRAQEGRRTPENKKITIGDREIYMTNVPLLHV